jgi:hypothetical protein
VTLDTMLYSEAHWIVINPTQKTKISLKLWANLQDYVVLSSLSSFYNEGLFEFYFIMSSLYCPSTRTTKTRCNTHLSHILDTILFGNSLDRNPKQKTKISLKLWANLQDYVVLSSLSSFYNKGLFEFYFIM